jgi:ABC-type transport system involved in multi-copper enzyme maturation permease subunit
MTFLPIVERELRERARWRSTYWVRGAAAFIATAVAMFVLMFMATATTGAIGHGMMVTLAWLAFPFVVLEGLRHTADCLSAEKREGTLGLLFLTDLRGYDVVLGKFFATSLTSFYALLAMMPALAVPVLLGGVTGGEFWRLMLALMNALFFSLTTGMFISAISRNERRAWAGTFVLIGLFVILIPAASKSLHIAWIWKLSPFNAFWLFDETKYSIRPADYWSSLGWPHLLSWCWLALASFLLPRVWQESGSRRVERKYRATLSPAKRNELLAINPVWWLTSRNTHQRRWLWLVVIVVSVAAAAAWIEFQGDTDALWAVFGCAIAVHLGLAVWVAFEACDSFSGARATGAMELLLSTPMTVRQILRGQHLALRELFFGPILFLLAVETCLVIGQIWIMSQSGSGLFEHILLIIVLGFCLVWFVVDLFAVGEVGMWYGLTSGKPTAALTKTILYVLILPLLVMAIPCFWAIAPGLMVAKSVIFFTWAQSKLETQFRRAATERFDPPKKPWLRREPPRLQMPG